MLNKLDIFDIDEQIAINNTISGENIKAFSREDFLKRIAFVLVINNDEQITSLYMGLKDKITAISNDEWKQICLYLPFDVPVDDNCEA